MDNPEESTTVPERRAVLNFAEAGNAQSIAARITMKARARWKKWIELNPLSFTAYSPCSANVQIATRKKSPAANRGLSTAGGKVD
jgi:hypothetical protein